MTPHLPEKIWLRIKDFLTAQLTKMRPNEITLIGVVLCLLLLSGWLFVRNYQECRTQFSVVYCLTTNR